MSTWLEDSMICPGFMVFEKDPRSFFLMRAGWKEVPADHGKTCWQAPVTFTGTPHYFTITEAYKMELGAGIWLYAGESLMAKTLYDDDVRRMVEEEREHFARTGKRLGQYPNW